MRLDWKELVEFLYFIEFVQYHMLTAIFDQTMACQEHDPKVCFAWLFDQLPCHLFHQITCLL